jgi:hypothetical protein
MRHGVPHGLAISRSKRREYRAVHAALTEERSGCPASTGCCRTVGSCTSTNACRTHKQPSRHTVAHDNTRTPSQLPTTPLVAQKMACMKQSRRAGLAPRQQRDSAHEADTGIAPSDNANYRAVVSADMATNTQRKWRGRHDDQRVKTRRRRDSEVTTIATHGPRTHSRARRQDTRGFQHGVGGERRDDTATTALHAMKARRNNSCTARPFPNSSQPPRQDELCDVHSVMPCRKRTSHHRQHHAILQSCRT